MLPSDQILDVAHQLVLALLSLHQMQPPLFHRDVTAENILLTTASFASVTLASPSTSSIPASPRPP